MDVTRPIERRSPNASISPSTCEVVLVFPQIRDRRRFVFNCLSSDVVFVEVGSRLSDLPVMLPPGRARPVLNGSHSSRRPRTVLIHVVLGKQRAPGKPGTHELVGSVRLHLLKDVGATRPISLRAASFERKLPPRIAARASNATESNRNGLFLVKDL